MRAASILALAVAAVSAQETVQKYKSSLDMTLPNVGAVEDSTRSGWCTAQSNTCTTLCDKDTKDNDCDYTTLEYKCTCTSNNSAPGLQYYQETMPTFICKELFSECINNSNQDADTQDKCTKNINDLCGTVNPSKASKGKDSSSETSTTAAPKSSKTSDSGSSGSDSSDSKGKATSTSSDDFAAPTAAPKAIAAVAALGLMAALV